MAARRAAVVSARRHQFAVIAHVEQLQFDIGACMGNLRPAHSTHGDGDPDIVNGLTANDR